MTLPSLLFRLTQSSCGRAAGASLLSSHYAHILPSFAFRQSPPKTASTRCTSPCSICHNISIHAETPGQRQAWRGPSSPPLSLIHLSLFSLSLFLSLSLSLSPSLPLFLLGYLMCCLKKKFRTHVCMYAPVCVCVLMPPNKAPSS